MGSHRDVGHKWTVHPTSISPTDMFLGDSVCGMDSPFMSNNTFKHSHRDVFGCIQTVCVVWTVHLCPTIPFKHSHRDVFECIRQCVWYGQSIYVQQSHVTPTEMFLGVYSVCGMDPKTSQRCGSA